MKPWFRWFKRAVELHFTGSTAVRFSGSTAPLPSSTGLNRVKPLCEVPDPNEHVGQCHEGPMFDVNGDGSL